MSGKASNHPKPLRLFDIARGQAHPTEPESQHLRECGGCQTVLSAFAKQFGKEDQRKENPGNAA